MRIKMTKFRRGEAHRCDDSCKVNHTTNFARENKMPTGSKINSTEESAENAYNAQIERVKETEKFVEDSNKLIRKEKEIGIAVRDKINNKEKEKISIPLAEIIKLAGDTKNISVMAMELDRALISLRRIG